MRRYDLSPINDPFNPITGLMNLFTQRAFPGDLLGEWNMPAVDIHEKEDGYVVKADLPGYSKEELDIRIDDNVLTLSAQHSEELKNESDGYLRQERRSSSFHRSFQFDAGIDHEKVKADYTNGVLTLELPKTEPHNRGRRIELQ
jgi:HSP20 family protein